jgi:hypothetical protein
VIYSRRYLYSGLGISPLDSLFNLNTKTPRIKFRRVHVLTENAIMWCDITFNFTYFPIKSFFFHAGSTLKRRNTRFCTVPPGSTADLGAGPIPYLERHTKCLRLHKHVHSLSLPTSIVLRQFHLSLLLMPLKITCEPSFRSRWPI